MNNGTAARYAAYMYIGGLIWFSGLATALFALIPDFPWNITGVVAGIVLIWGGAKLFFRGFHGH